MRSAVGAIWGSRSVPDLRSPHSIVPSQKPAAPFLAGCPPSPARPARRIYVLNRARAIENRAFVLAAARKAAAPERRRGILGFARGRSVGANPCKGASEPGVILARTAPAEVSAARAKIPSLQNTGGGRDDQPMAEPVHLHAVRGPAWIRHALACDKGHSFESWFQRSAASTSRPAEGTACLSDLETREEVESADRRPSFSARKRSAEPAPRRSRSDPAAIPGDAAALRRSP